MSPIGKAVRRTAAASLIAATAALTLGVGSAAASTDKPPYDPKSVVAGYPGTIPAIVADKPPYDPKSVVAVGPGPLPAIVAREPGPFPAIVARDPQPIPMFLPDPGPLPPVAGTDKPPYDPKS